MLEINTRVEATYNLSFQTITGKGVIAGMIRWGETEWYIVLFDDGTEKDCHPRKVKAI